MNIMPILIYNLSKSLSVFVSKFANILYFVHNFVQIHTQSHVGAFVFQIAKIQYLLTTIINNFMFNIKSIEDNIESYSKEEMLRKIQVVGIKSKDLEEEVQNLLKDINDLEIRNSILEFNMHGVTKDRVQDVDKVVFDGSFSKYKTKMEKEVDSYANIYNQLIKQNEIIQKNYNIIQVQNTQIKQRIRSLEEETKINSSEAQKQLKDLEIQYQTNKKKQHKLIEEKKNLQKELQEMIRFYSTIGDEIEKLSQIKKNKGKKKDQMAMQLQFLKQDSEIRHFKDKQRMQSSKKAIKRMEGDLVKMQDQLQHMRKQNQMLRIIKVETQGRH